MDVVGTGKFNFTFSTAVPLPTKIAGFISIRNRQLKTKSGPRLREPLVAAINPCG